MTETDAIGSKGPRGWSDTLHAVEAEHEVANNATLDGLIALVVTILDSGRAPFNDRASLCDGCCMDLLVGLTDRLSEPYSMDQDCLLLVKAIDLGPPHCTS